MNKYDNEVICSHIAVDCKQNDMDDIKIGGPQYIGYDFYVAREETDEMMDYIKETLHKFKAPLISIYVEGAVVKDKDKVWTKEKIYKCIENNEAGLDQSDFLQDKGKGQDM